MLNEVQPKDVLCRSQRLLCRKEKHVYATLNPSDLVNNVTGPLQYKLDCWLAIQCSFQAAICTEVLVLSRAANTKLLSSGSHFPATAQVTLQHGSEGRAAKGTKQPTKGSIQISCQKV